MNAILQQTDDCNGSAVAMVRNALLLFAIATTIGCDAVSHTHIVVRQRSLPASEPTRFADTVTVRIIQETASEFGFNMTKVVSDGLYLNDIVAGENPNIFIMAKPESSAIRVEIAEIYISSPTEKHRRLVDSLMQRFNAEGLDARTVYRTESSDLIIWLLLIAAFTFTIAVWLAVRAWHKRSRKPAVESRESFI